MCETEKGQFWQEWARKMGNIKPTLAFALPDKRDTGQIRIPQIRRARPAPAHTDCRAQHLPSVAMQTCGDPVNSPADSAQEASTAVTNLSAYQLFDCSWKYEVFPFLPSLVTVPCVHKYLHYNINALCVLPCE